MIIIQSYKPAQEKKGSKQIIPTQQKRGEKQDTNPEKRNKGT